jgi:hypothetical protein
MPPPLRILHCPDVVGGYGYALAREERRLGHKSWSVAFDAGPYRLENDEYLWRPGDSRLRKEVGRWRLLLRALRDFDVVHFNFGRTLFGPRYFPAPADRPHWPARLRNWVNGLLDLQDLKLLKRAGKVIAMTYQGDDARQGDVLQRLAPVDLARELPAGYYSRASDAYKRWRIRQVARYADLIYALNPDLLRLLPPGARFLPYPHVDARDWQPCPPASAGPPLVLHAPTHRGIKGTRHVLDAVRRLRDEGVRFQFQLVEGLPRAEALALYGRADLLIDQLVVGWYGGLAVEMMALARPVVCHVRDADLHVLPAAMRRELPIIRATPADLHAVLREWLAVRRHELGPLGVRSRIYVERWHDPRKIAASVVQDYLRSHAARRALAG